MKKSLAHLPQLKKNELELITFKIRSLCDDVQMVVLFGSYARGDWKDGQHSQGRGRLIIHKKSDYDILVITEDKKTARNIGLSSRHTQYEPNPRLTISSCLCAFVAINPVILSKKTLHLKALILKPSTKKPLTPKSPH